MRMDVTRRFIIGPGAAAAVAGLGVAAPRAGAQGLAPTPQCEDGDAPTTSQTEGPYFTPNSPRKTDFRKDAAGEALTLAGFVLGTDCTPIRGALVDLWHANADGDYDNAGYLLRGHQYTDGDGRFIFETIAPGLYPGRTRHYHVKVQRPGGRILTTQLYFPGEPRNAGDGIFRESLVLDIGESGGGKVGRYDFVLR